jgi:hypothetical protein
MCHKLHTIFNIWSYHTPRRTLSQLENYNFSGERKNHWSGRRNCFKRMMTLLPSRGHFRKWTCDAIPLGRYGLRHASCGHNSTWAFLSCDTSSRGTIWWSSLPKWCFEKCLHVRRHGTLCSKKSSSLKFSKSRTGSHVTYSCEMAWIIIANVRHVTSGAGRTKFQAAWFLLNRVYKGNCNFHYFC